MKIKILGAFAALWVALAHTAGASVMILQQGVESYSGCQDTYLWADGFQLWQQDTNFGTEETLLADCWRPSAYMS